jgi:hypothetical protein
VDAFDKGFASENDAIERLVSLLQVPPAALRRFRPKLITKASVYDGVFWHSARIGWFVKDAMGKYYASEVECARSAKLKRKLFVQPLVEDRHVSNTQGSNAV